MQSGAMHQRRFRLLKLATPIVLSWGLAAALVVSLTARAGEDRRVIDHEFRRSTMIEPHRVTLTPPRLSTLLLQGSGTLGSADTESEVRALPLLQHIRKVDFSRDLRPAPRGNPLIFINDTALFPSRGLDPAVTLARAGKALFARLTRFEGRTLEFGSGGSGRSADVAAQGASPQILSMSRPDGTSPSAGRAAVLASVTPAPIEPEVVAASAMRIPAFARAHQDGPAEALAPARLALGPQLNLVDPQAIQRERQCLAEAVYFEARSESETGQAAVAQVVINRAQSGLYPKSICGVVYQNQHRFRACQFTFACEGKSLAIKETASWRTAQRIANNVLDGATYLPAVGTSTHYHADYVAPWWSRKLKRTDQIGRHIFYRLRPGQT